MKLKTNIDYYLSNFESGYSLMNNTFKDEMYIDDYVEVLLTETSKYRLDKVADHVYGDKRYYIFIMWANLNVSLESIGETSPLNAGEKIKLPTLDYIYYFVNKHKIKNKIK